MPWFLPRCALVVGALGVAMLSSAAAASGQQTHLVVISGAGGEEEYRDRFHEWGASIAGAAIDKYGLDAADVVWLAESPERDPRIDGPSRGDDVRKALTDVATRAGAEDAVVIVLIGHGSFNGGESRFNVPGRDLTDGDFALLLEQFGTRKVVFVNTASSSGGFIETMSGPNRTVITATRSSRERNATLFAGFFAEALAGEGADTDKDERVSLLEAFIFARREVVRSYEERNLLATEHAVLDDNGDGEGSDFEDEGDLDGALARTVFLAPGLARAANGDLPADPELAELFRKRQDLEERIAALRALKDDMETELYEAELEELVVELALTTRAIRRKEGGGGR